MKAHLLLAALVLLTLGASSCRGAQIRQLEARIDKLEAHQAALDAKVEMLTKK
jgi:outer membrane murein-binding lipoprotein Lpp